MSNHLYIFAMCDSDCARCCTCQFFDEAKLAAHCYCSVISLGMVMQVAIVVAVLLFPLASQR